MDDDIAHVFGFGNRDDLVMGLYNLRDFYDPTMFHAVYVLTLAWHGVTGRYIVLYNTNDDNTEGISTVFMFDTSMRVLKGDKTSAYAEFASLFIPIVRDEV